MNTKSIQIGARVTPKKPSLTGCIGVIRAVDGQEAWVAWEKMPDLESEGKKYPHSLYPIWLIDWLMLEGSAEPYTESNEAQQSLRLRGFAS